VVLVFDTQNLSRDGVLLVQPLNRHPRERPKSLKGPMGKPFLPHRPVVEGCIYRLKGGIPWRMLPSEYGAWQTVHRRHQRWSQDGTWDRILAALQSEAQSAGEIDWQVSVDSTISRVHQHGATAARCSSGPSSHTGGSVELQGSAAS
jgi:transposase